MPDYDEEEARKGHMRPFDFAGQKAEIVISQLEEGPVILSTGVILCDKVHLEQTEESQQKLYESMVGKLQEESQQKLYKSMVGELQVAATPFGLKQSPKVLATKLEELGGWLRTG